MAPVAPMSLALIVALPLLAFVAFSSIDLVTDLMDPCRTWGDDDGVTLVRPDDACPARSGTSLTRSDAVATHFAFQGLLLYGAVAGIVGARRHFAAVTALGAAALLFVAVPAMIGMLGVPLVALSVVLFVAAALLHREPRHPAKTTRVLIGFLAVLAVLVLFHLVVIPDANPFFLVAYPTAAAVGVAAVWTTWPRGPGSHPRGP